MKRCVTAVCLIWSLFFGFFYIINSYAQSVEDFAKLPAISNPQISPDGKQVAYAIILQDKPVIVTKNLYNPDEKFMGLIALEQGQYNWFKWVNNDRLLISIQHVIKRRNIGTMSVNRFYTIDKTGKNPVYFDMEPHRTGYLLQYPDLVHLLPDDPDHVLMMLDSHEEVWATGKVHKVNVYTGKKTLVEPNKRAFYQFFSDSKGNVRLATQLRNDAQAIRLFYRKTPHDSWELLQFEKLLSNKVFIPQSFDPSNDDVLLFYAGELSDQHQQKNNIFRYDLNRHTILGPYQHTHEQPALNSLLKAFPNKTVDLVSTANAVTLDKAFFKVHSDVTPPQYFLYDAKEKSVSYFGSEYSALDDITLHPMSQIQYPARDGLTIPAYLTVPVSITNTIKKKLPLIVYPHDDPNGKDDWGFDNYVQFFAHEGYVVFQPQFRGSKGYGYEHETAGYQQWGLGIQNDIVDGIRWLIDKEIADPNNICIVGRGFGGYAAAIGLAQNPELFKCGISIDGILDLQRHYNYLNKLVFATLSQSIFNPKSNLTDVSPLHQSKNIQDPLLLIASEKNPYVDRKHSESMHKALKKQKKPVEYITLPKGEHAKSIESNEIILLKTMQTFLREHLKTQNTSQLAHQASN